MELTLDSVYERIATSLAQARTLALMGELSEARGLYKATYDDYVRFQDTLQGFAGISALKYALEVTQAALFPPENPHPVRKRKSTRGIK